VVKRNGLNGGFVGGMRGGNPQNAIEPYLLQGSFSSEQMSPVNRVECAAKNAYLAHNPISSFFLESLKRMVK
jgi:hypothetical protein